jgi:hypothetical protein
MKNIDSQLHKIGAKESKGDVISGLDAPCGRNWHYAGCLTNQRKKIPVDFQ